MAERERFRRRAMRRGYKVDEVDVFLDRVEETLAGRPDGPPVTPQDVRDVVFRVRFGGYDEWQVDVALDRLERQLVALEQSGLVASLPEDGYDDGYDRGYAPAGRGPREYERPDPRRSGRDDVPTGSYDRYGTTPSGSFGLPGNGAMPPRSRSGNTHSGGFPVAPRYAGAGDPASTSGELPRAAGAGGRAARTNPGMTVPQLPAAGFAPPGGGPAPAPPRGRGAVYGASAPPPSPAPGRHGRSDITGEVPPARPQRPSSSADAARVAELRGTFSSRRFGSGYDPGQVDRLFDAVEATLEGRSAGALDSAELDPARLQLVPGGYYENEVEKAMREVRGLLGERRG